MWEEKLWIGESYILMWSCNSHTISVRKYLLNSDIKSIVFFIYNFIN